MLSSALANLNVREKQMKNGFLFTLLSISLALQAPCALANDQARPENIGEFIMQMQALTLRPLVDYCISEHPERSDDLNRAYEKFAEKLLETGQPAIEALSTDPSFNSPVPEEMRVKVEEFGEAMLTEAQGLDSNTYCNSIHIRMREATVEQLRAGIFQHYDDFIQHTFDTDPDDNPEP
jgi:hypothetical protein